MYNITNIILLQKKHKLYFIICYFSKQRCDISEPANISFVNVFCYIKITGLVIVKYQLDICPILYFPNWFPHKLPDTTHPPKYPPDPQINQKSYHHPSNSQNIEPMKAPHRVSQTLQ